ncbi:hypothetical protein RUM43_003570 [Polyplax serrata]|uniref:Beta-1,4-N-acetylgalactosaminyltransferase n=1 Tax=Polyplax serrata TaxID=468196 RepID=A0AAN8S5M0_POLSC
MKFLQRLKANLLKVTLIVVATLLIVQYWPQDAVDSPHRFEPLFLINSSRSKLGYLTENLTVLAIEEFQNGSYTLNSSSYSTPILTGIPTCPPIPPNLTGPIKIRVTFEKFSVIEKDFVDLEPGGIYRPKDCKARNVVALVIPYRDRPAQLAIFLNNIHRLLMKQQIDYRIFVIEQDGNGPFNRGKLLNVGFTEALKLRDFDCFIFHDVDLIPEDDRNLYTCPEQPRHMSVAVDKFHYALPYRDLFGGVCAFTTEHFKLTNGFSNVFWGWGGEDDDLYTRLRRKGLNVSRYPPTIARYTMLPHAKQTPNPRRYEIMEKGRKTQNRDGLNSLSYNLRKFENKKLYTWILVELKPPPKWWLMGLFRLWKS